MLKEGEYHIEYSASFEQLLDPSVKAIWVVDSSGKEWELPTKRLKKLRAESAKPQE